MRLLQLLLLSIASLTHAFNPDVLMCEREKSKFSLPNLNDCRLKVHFNQGNPQKADSAALRQCLADISRATEVKLPWLDMSEPSKTHWNNRGWLCGDRIWQFGTEHHVKNYPTTILKKCKDKLDLAADEGRNWARCSVTSPMGMTRRHWISWSPRGCRNGDDSHREPDCHEKHKAGEANMAISMDGAVAGGAVIGTTNGTTTATSTKTVG